MTERSIRVANMTITVESSPVHHGLSWLNCDMTDTPELTPHQMTRLAKKLMIAADEIEEEG